MAQSTLETEEEVSYSGTEYTGDRRRSKFIVAQSTLETEEEVSYSRTEYTGDRRSKL